MIKKQTLWERTKFDAMILGIELGILSCKRRNKILRKRFCHYGFHNMRRQVLILGKSNIKGNYKEEKVEFLECRVCNYMFFAHEKDKKKHEKMCNKFNDTQYVSVKKLLDKSLSMKVNLD